MSPTPLPVFLHLLASSKLAPGAALLVFQAGAADVLSQLAADHGFGELAAGFPCLLASGPALAPDLLASLNAAGCTVVEPSALHRSDEATPPVLPAPAQWLQGDWYLAPPQHPTTAQSASRALALKLLQLVMADAETRDIEAVLRQDPTLSYHLLRLVNSLGMGATRRVTSFSQAIVILGRTQLRRWLNLMLFAARSDDHRAGMLLARVALRSRTMELLAKDAGLDRADQDQAFMAGMFSLLGVLFGTPLPELVKPLQLSDELTAALLQRQGEIGRLLHMVEQADQFDAAGVTSLLAELQLTPAQFTLRSVEACQWMLGIARDVEGGAHG